MLERLTLIGLTVVTLTSNVVKEVSFHLAETVIGTVTMLVGEWFAVLDFKICSVLCVLVLEQT